MDAPTRPTEEQCQENGQEVFRLPALLDDELSDEAADQLVRMVNDNSRVAYKGKSVPTADAAAVLAKARSLATPDEE